MTDRYIERNLNEYILKKKTGEKQKSRNFTMSPESKIPRMSKISIMLYRDSNILRDFIYTPVQKNGKIFHP